MNGYPQANIAGVFRKLLAEDWLMQPYGGGMKYMRKGVLMQSSTYEPIYSYGHNYEKFGENFSLFMWTAEKDKEKVSKYFDDVVNSLTKTQIKKVTNKTDRFLYVDKEYN